ncbi:hypothetical protein PATSB16_24680 [Pandoraea thiooxydans]|nr:hypothetical protein PATSB16_24680 [Pandoraea thiooxydans]
MNFSGIHWQLFRSYQLSEDTFLFNSFNETFLKTMTSFV